MKSALKQAFTRKTTEPLVASTAHVSAGGAMAHSEQTDQQLVERAQKGDSRAYDLLVIKYQHRVMALIARFINDSMEVQDVAQEAFIKAYRALPNFRGDSAFYTWLYRIAVNTAKNYLVARKRRPPASDVDAEDALFWEGDNALKQHDSPETQLAGEQLMNAVNQAIQALPEDLRVALTLREYDGLSYEAIAEVMKCPVGTVRSRIFRAREAVDLKVQPYLERDAS